MALYVCIRLHSLDQSFFTQVAILGIKSVYIITYIRLHKH